MFTEFIILCSVALLDSLNPVAIATLLILLSKVENKGTVGIFIISTFITYFAGGILIYFGVGLALERLLELLINIKGPWVSTVELILGIALLIMVYKRLSSKEPADTKSKQLGIFFLSLPGLFVLGVSSTLADLPTAIPYLGWIAFMNDKEFSLALILLFFTIYNLLYVLPLIILQLLYVRHQVSIERRTKKLHYWLGFISRWSITIFAIAGGIWFCYDAVLALIN
jgi:cytochrome c biogenesis protein CcdA